MLAPSAMFHHSMACQALALPCAPLQRARTILPLGRRHVGRLRCESSAAAGAAEGRGGFLVESASPPRRSAGYQPSLWTDSFIQSLTSDYTGEAHMAKLEELKGRVSHLLKEAVGVAAQLELADVLHRLGLAYHFEQEIESMLHAMSTNLDDSRRKLHGDLTHTALLFRLLRQHGVPVPQEVFDNFKDEHGGFKTSLGDDVVGVLSLYEASFLAFEGEEALDNARDFAIACLKQILLGRDVDLVLRERVEYALEMPLRWRVPRVYARWFIDVCKREGKLSSVLLEFAKLDFNIVQSAHRSDIRAVSRWWEDLGFQKLSFSRDRIMECFFPTIGMTPEPQLWYCRRDITQLHAFLTIIDDIYDVYGTIDELEFFTEAVERWDVDEIEKLPDYMKVLFQELFNITSEFAHQCIKKSGFNCLSYLKRSLCHYCKSVLVEARWYQSKHMTTFGEYMENSWISSGGPTIFTLAYFLSSKRITREALDSIENYGDLIRWSSTILRLTNDLATSVAESERGDVPKSIQCHMHERNVSEIVAREHMKSLISDTWLMINNGCSLNKSLPKSFVNATINLVRISHCLYQHGNGFSAPNKEIVSHIDLLLIEPIH